MELFLKRTPNGKATWGVLQVDGFFECYTLEDELRPMTPDTNGDGIAEGKVMGETAIPAGRYQITIRYSKRFQKMMIALLDVPFFTGILIHGGNTISDTHGCILVGDKLTEDKTKIVAGTSGYAIKRLFVKINTELLYHREVWITIE